MKVGLIDCDKRGPNLALMKISAFYKAQGVEVAWFAGAADAIFASKVFTYNKVPDLPKGTLLSGSGVGDPFVLPEEIEHICPDYTLYGLDYSIGFLTRGCCNKCPWCFVPEKEGGLRANAVFEEFVRHEKVAFYDNNVLASPHGIKEIERLAGSGLKVDFNQGLDARLIDDGVARRLARLKWWRPVRLACDTKAQMKAVQKAVTALRWHNCTPTRYFVYLLVQNIDDALERVRFLKGLALDVFAQPYRDKEGNEPTDEQKDFARWVNHKAIFKSVAWAEYRRRRI